MVKFYELTTGFIEPRPLENSVELFKNFRSAVLRHIDTFEHVHGAKVFYEDKTRPVEISVQFLVSEPISKATKEADSLIEKALKEAGIHLSTPDDETSHLGVYAEDGVHLVSI